MRTHRGFTLIELMIVVVIVAILAAIAYPSYQEQVRKTRRADAGGVLAQSAQWMERFFTENSRYDQDRAGDAVSLPFDRSPLEGTQAYTISLVAGDLGANTFTVQAVPTGPQTGDRCGKLTMDQLGQKDIVDAAAGLAVADCW